MTIRWIFLILCQLLIHNSKAQEDLFSKAFFIPLDSEAKKVKLQSINEARKEILISYFIFKDDPIGLISLEHLVIAKEKNPDLDIKIILDASANGVSKYITQYIIDHGIEIKEFHPLPHLFVYPSEFNPIGFFRKLGRVNNRMHDKIILTDGYKMVVGGRNISKKYYGLAEKNFDDLDAYIESNTLGSEISNYFYQLWNSEHCSPVRTYYYHKKGKKYERTIAKMKSIRNYIQNHPKHVELLADPIDMDKRFIKLEKSQFLNCFDENHKKFIAKNLSTKLMQIVGKVKDSIIIETPYLLPTKRFYHFLSALQKKGIKTSIVTNSVCSTDVMAVAAAYDNEKSKILELGVKIFEYKGPKYLHTKAAVVDNNISLIGSYNLDPRSAYLNTENVYILEGKDISSSLYEIIQSDKNNAVEIKLINGKLVGGYNDCDKNFKDELVYSFFSLITHFNFVYGLL